MSYDPLLAVLGLSALASAVAPTTFDPTAYRGGVAIAPAALPSNPTDGTLAIDSGASNALKWWDGAAWQTAGGGGGTPAGSSTEVQYNNAGSFGASVGFAWDDTNRRLGISDAATLFAPLASLHLSKNTNTGMRADTYSSTAAATAGIQLYKARGTAAVPAAIQANDVMGFVGSYGYYTGGSSGFSNQSRVKIEFKAANTWTDVSQGAALALWTTAVGAVAATERVRLYANGGMQIGGTGANWGTSPGNGVLTIMQNQYIAPLTGTVLQVVGSNNVKSRIEIVAFNTSGGGAYATFTGRTSRGNAANPSASLANDILVGISACGYGATAWPTTNKGLIHINAAENWTDSAQGTYIGFDTTAPGGIVTTEKVRIYGNGGVQIGGTLGTSPGASALLVNGVAAFGTAAISTSTALNLPASTTGVSSLRVPHGTAPTAPVDGDLWSTTAGFFGRVNGATVGPFGAGGGTPAGADTQIQFNNTGSFGASSDLTWGSSTLTVTGAVLTSASYAAEFGFATGYVFGGAYIQSTLLGRGFQARVKPSLLPAELVFTASFNDTSGRPEFTVYGLLLPPGPLPGTPTLGTVAIDWSGNVLKWYNGTSWQAAGVTIPLSLGVPSAEGADRTLTNTDNGKNLICTGTRIFTVNTGLTSGFGCSFKGTVSFTGTATVTDVRTTGATNPWCALCATGTDTYDIVGSKV